LSDFDPHTGKARKIQTFAADLNIPIGLLPLPDGRSALVSSVGEIRLYTDTNGDGKADTMEVLFRGFGSDDTHGMTNSFTLMPDGWVYACHGFRNDSTVKGRDGHEVKMNSGNTFRFRPDGSRIEVWTRGQVNPFGMTIDPWFNLYTADCHSKPITQLIPGATYQSFAKPHDGLGFAPHVTAHAHGSTGLCGVTWYDADHFPPEYRGTMFVGNVVTNRINFDRIVWHGASPVAKELPDFLVSPDRWFRPVDLQLGPDGALYVADFYNKIIGHYEVDLRDPRRDKDRGRIWRIVWKGRDGQAPNPRFHRNDFTKASSDELLDDLLHPNRTVRFLAGHQLLHRIAHGQGPKGEWGEPMVQKLAAHPERVSEFLGWVVGMEEARRRTPPPSMDDYRAILKVVTSPQRVGLKPEQITGHLTRMVASRTRWGDDERRFLLERLAAAASVHETRACVDAMILHPHPDFIAPLVKLFNTALPTDTHLRHAIKVALRNSLRDLKTWPESTEPLFVDIALAIANPQAAHYLATRINTPTFPADKWTATAEHIARYGTAADEDTLFAALLQNRNSEALVAALRGVQARGQPLSAERTKTLLRAAETALAAEPRSDEVPTLRWVIRLLNALPPLTAPQERQLRPAAVQRLEQWLGHTQALDEVRVGAAEVLLHYAPATAVKAIRRQLADTTTPEGVRTGLLLACAASNYTDAQLDARDALATVPYRIAVPIATSFASTKGGAEVLLEAVRAGKAPARLLQERTILERLRATNVDGWQKRVAALTQNLPPADQRIAAAIQDRITGFARAKTDVAEGAKIFSKHCAACHKIGEQGGKIAPQLDGIGVRGVERLLEDILDPNRNVDAAFRARVITLTNEQTLTALLLRVEGQVLVVADLEGKERRIPLSDIASNRETSLSAMPANFVDTIPEAELYHLLAYLLTQRPPEPTPQ
ncbi:MAG: c-type cytochrome, partial [Gemmataceae bacterium]|nr:c-type cytochrome [Gemmata sp.]MDW8197237.1 c-type cytochrome [Gemmataceae bacterium]